MPIVEVQTNVILDATAIEKLSLAFTEAMVSLLQHSQGDVSTYTCPRVFVSLSHASTRVDGSLQPAAQVVVRSATELSSQNKRELCERLVKLLASHCAISEERVFLQITRVPAEEAYNVEFGCARSVADRLKNGVVPEPMLAHAVSGD
jgi:hypothetical protein